jgi:hypothetical protein
MNQNIIGNYSVDLPERPLKETDADSSLHLDVKAYHTHDAGEVCYANPWIWNSTATTIMTTQVIRGPRRIYVGDPCNLEYIKFDSKHTCDLNTFSS